MLISNIMIDTRIVQFILVTIFLGTSMNGQEVNIRADVTGDRVYDDVKVGDKILFGKYSGNEIKVDGEECLIMREDEILAVLED